MSAFDKYRYPSLDDVIPGCVSFRWREFLYLQKVDAYVYPTAIIYDNLIKTAKIMDSIRGRLGGKPLEIVSGWRPQWYNTMIGGAHLSSHMEGLACDFKSSILTSDKMRELLAPELTRLNIRMEDNPGSSWVHIDLRPPVYGRLFKP